MTLTKAELERIWRDEPVGYVKSKFKGKKKKPLQFKVTVKPYVIVEKPYVDYFIFAASRSEAELEAQKRYRSSDDYNPKCRMSVVSYMT